MEQTRAFTEHLTSGTLIPRKILLQVDSFERFKQDLRYETSGAGSSERHKYLKKRYWGAPRETFRDLKVRWDYRRAALRLNWELFEHEQAGCQLYEIDSALLRSNLWGGQNYDIPFVFEKAEWYLFLPVVDRWEVGAPLTPPALELRLDGKLEKSDGFHRLAVALLAGERVIPFWADLPSTFIGVRSLAEE